MFNENFIWGFFLADRERKRLEEKGATDIPTNFGIKHAMFHGMTNMPAVPSLLLSDEVSKLDPPISTTAKAEIEKVKAENVALNETLRSEKSQLEEKLNLMESQKSTMLDTLNALTADQWIEIKSKADFIKHFEAKVPGYFG